MLNFVFMRSAFCRGVQPTTQTFLGLRHAFLPHCVTSQKNVRVSGKNCPSFVFKECLGDLKYLHSQFEYCRPYKILASENVTTVSEVVKNID